MSKIFNHLSSTLYAMSELVEDEVCDDCLFSCARIGNIFTSTIQIASPVFKDSLSVGVAAGISSPSCSSSYVGQGLHRYFARLFQIQS